MVAALLYLVLGYFTTFALALNHGHQFIKEVMELPVVDQCDLGYVYEQSNEENFIELIGILPQMR